VARPLAVPWPPEQDVRVTFAAGIAGLVLTPGAGAGRDQPALVAVDRAVTRGGLAVERIEFPGRTAGRRRPDPPEVCIDSVRAATVGLAGRLGVPTSAIAVGGRSMGGRMCSMAAAGGLEVAALVLISYPLHPAGKPDRLRTVHFHSLHVPCLFVSGRRDALGSPDELERETAAIPGPVTLVFVDGDHALRRRDTEVADIVDDWLAGRSSRSGP
jgi:predicted alpha/beta-hydrolase family hydrolase